MKRKVVQHGPSTLTISLPASWVKERGVGKGDELSVEPYRTGLYISAERSAIIKRKKIDVSGIKHVLTKSIAALYKAGYDEIIIQYSTVDELESIYSILTRSCIGMEVVTESKNEVAIRSVSEPSREEFHTLFRRVFYFVLNIAEEGYDAAKTHDKERYKKLTLRDEMMVDKLSNFCRRIINKKGETGYAYESVLYHIVEQIETIGDRYKEINDHLQQRDRPTEAELKMYRDVNELLKAYESLFFSFDLKKMDHFVGRCKDFEVKAHSKDPHLMYLLESIAKELYSLNGSTMALHL